MNRRWKVLPLLLLCAVVIGLAGCAGTNDTNDGAYSPTEAPSKDDLSRGWGPTSTQ